MIGNQLQQSQGQYKDETDVIEGANKKVKGVAPYGTTPFTL
jgi:hypothetical protein